MLLRLTRDVPAFLRQPITLAESIAWQDARLATREQALMRVAEQQFYAIPDSPHAQLLRAAGCELGDLRVLVQQEGVEGALAALAARGVYVTFDELKGTREAVRGSQRFSFTLRQFDNSRVSAHFAARTGGTGGTRHRVLRSLPFLLETGYCTMTAFSAHGLLAVPQGIWLTGPVNLLLRYPKMGVPMRAWFYPLAPLPWNVRVGGWYLAALGRLAGHRVPVPAFADIQQPERLVRWLTDQPRKSGRICLLTTVSSAVRIAASATAAGVSLDGVVFFVRSEPYTEARQRTIEASGAQAFSSYGMTEASMIGIGCAAPSAPDDVHVMDTRYAVVQRARQQTHDAPTGRSTGDPAASAQMTAGSLDASALMVTTLSDHAPKTLLNVETGDSALLERRACNCRLGAQGLRTHLSHIRSFEKLTGEGMTFARTNLTHVIESVLPGRFGGTSIDYQLLEQELAGGLPRLVLRVSPAVGTVDEAALRTAFLAALAQDGDLERYMAAFWARANTIAVERAIPLVTAAGKVLPFHPMRAAATPSRVP